MESTNDYIKGEFFIYLNREDGKTRFEPETPQEVTYEEEKYSIRELRLNSKALVKYINGINFWSRSSIIKKGRIERKLFEQLTRNRLENMNINERLEMMIKE